MFPDYPYDLFIIFIGALSPVFFPSIAVRARNSRLIKQSLASLNKFDLLAVVIWYAAVISFVLMLQPIDLFLFLVSYAIIIGSFAIKDSAINRFETAMLVLLSFVTLLLCFCSILLFMK
jgi:hypothetical protein